MTNDNNVTSTNDMKREYPHNWDGVVCDDCGEECVWDGEEGTLSCGCETRSGLDVYLGDTPNERT